MLAKSGQKTLIIDCDLRRPRIARAFGLSGTSGLTNVLVGELSLDEAIRSSEVENLSVLPAGSTPPNPAELLSGQHFASFWRMRRAV